MDIWAVPTFRLSWAVLLWTCVWRRRWHPTPVLLPGKSHGRRSLVGCSPWGRWELDTTERLHFHFSLSCIGEGNGNPLQCCCLENPRDGGAWWAAVYGVTQSQTRLKRLSSSSSRTCVYKYLLASYFQLFWYISWSGIAGSYGNWRRGMATHSSILTWRIPMDREAWQATVHGVAKSWTRLSDFHFFTSLQGNSLIFWDRKSVV